MFCCRGSQSRTEGTCEDAPAATVSDDRREAAALSVIRQLTCKASQAKPQATMLGELLVPKRTSLAGAAPRGRPQILVEHLLMFTSRPASGHCISHPRSIRSNNIAYMEISPFPSP
eukprot:4323-Eustigmatos_ZCMA.PRE.1